MTVEPSGWRAGVADEIRFLLTNCIPRRTATRLVGWLSRIEHPWVARPAIALWRAVGGIDLSDAAETRFVSVRACFTRRLRPGARPVDPDPGVLVSPCDAIVGAHGVITGDEILQVKGSPYRLSTLLGSAADAAAMTGGYYVTLRLTAAMYHHFHAPQDLTVERIRYLPGDCWNVHPPALRRVPRLFCRNERATIHCRLDDGRPLILVAVAAILVAGIRLRFVDGGLRSLAGDRLDCAERAARGVPLGWFEHGSTIVLLAPPGFGPDAAALAMPTVRMGAALLCRTEP